MFVTGKRCRKFWHHHAPVPSDDCHTEKIEQCSCGVATITHRYQTCQHYHCMSCHKNWVQYDD